MDKKEHLQSVIEKYKVDCPSKSLLSESGWIFLINDGNDFISTQFGLSTWNAEEIQKVSKTYLDRYNAIASLNATYLEFVIPEKSVFYSEYLPQELSQFDISPLRPSAIMRDLLNLPNYHYALDYLNQFKPIDKIYFLGDTHTSYIGSYYLYCFIVNCFSPHLKSRNISAIPPSTLRKRLVGYDGDVFTQLPEIDKNHLYNSFVKQKNEPYEWTYQYLLPEDRVGNSKLTNDTSYNNFSKDRPTYVFENNDKSLPRAVFFRDSTADNLIDLLACHFSRSVFIWHHGCIYRHIIEQEKPDFVFYITAERFLKPYPYRKILN